MFFPNLTSLSFYPLAELLVQTENHLVMFLIHPADEEQLKVVFKVSFVLLMFMLREADPHDGKAETR